MTHFAKGQDFVGQFFEDIQDIFFRTDINGKILLISPSVSQHGYKPEDLIGTNVVGVYADPNERSRLIDILYANKVVRDFEIGILKRDGSKVTVSVSSRLVEDPPGVPVAVEGIIRDISFRKEAERLLQESEIAYRLLFENNPMPMWVFDMDTLCFLAVNAAAVKHYGYSADEFLRMTILDIRPPEECERLLDEIRRIPFHSTPGPRSTKVWTHQKKDGSLITVEVTGADLHFQGRRASMVLAKDITEKRKADEALKRSEKQYRDLIDNSPALVCTHSTSGEMLSVNRAGFQMLGYRPEEMIGKSIADFLAPDRRGSFTDYLSEILNQGVASGVLRAVTKDGNRKVLLYKNVLIDVAGEEPYILAHAQDITERYEAEQALGYRMAFEQLIMNISTELIKATNNLDEKIREGLRRLAEFARVDRSFIFIFGNERKNLDMTHEWCGPDIEPKQKELQNIPSSVCPWMRQKLEHKESIYFRKISDLPDDAQEDKKFLAHHGVRSLFVVPLVYSDNLIGLLGFEASREEQQWASDLLSLLKVAGEMFVNAILRDMTERALRESEEKYRALFEESKDLIFVSTPEGKFLDINPAGLQILGFSSKEELLKVDIAEELYIHPEDRQRYCQILDRQGFVKDFEVQLKQKDGKKLLLLESATAVHDALGRTVAYRGIGRDVTHVKELQAQLLQSQKMETIGHLAGGVAHDFNNILMAISSYCELLKLTVTPAAQVAQYMDEILKAVDHGSSLTKRLLAFGRKQILSPKTMNLSQLVFRIQEILQTLVTQRIQLILDLEPNLYWIRADHGQMEQVVMNLVVNARDAISQGGTIKIRTANLDLQEKEGHPTLHNMAPGKYVMLSVNDTGSGIDPGIRSRVFEPFFTTKGVGAGSGLGLSTVYGIVKQTGGLIDFESQPGKGSHFYILLPGFVEPSGGAKTVPLVDGIRPCTVLVVDDNEAVRLPLGNLLSHNGYFVLQASGAEEAIDVARSVVDIDILITDVMMPNVSGHQLARRLAGTFPKMKVVFISGYMCEDTEFSAENPGLSWLFLQKPVSMTSILSAVRQLLNPEPLES